MSADHVFHSLPLLEFCNKYGDMPRRMDRISPQWLRRFLGHLGKGLQPAMRTLCIEERLVVGGKLTVTLIACRGRRFLLASSGDVIASLTEVLPIEEQSVRQDEERSQ